MFHSLYLWLCAAVILISPAAWAKVTLLAQMSDNETATVSQRTVDPAPQESITANAITLSAAIERALSRSPRLKSASAGMMASKGEWRQSGLLPNPDIDIEAENIAGQGLYRRTDSAEFTYGVSQLIEIGGKRSARQEAASKGYEIARLDYEAARLDLIRDVTIAYAEAVAAQEQVKLAKEQNQLAKEVLESVSNRVAAAAAPLVQKSKAEAAQAISEIAFSKAMRELKTAKKKLASLWGQDDNGYILDESDFVTIGPPFMPADATTRLQATPDIARLDARFARAKATLDLEQANAIPDPTFSVGLREFRETRDQAFVVGVSLPIPVWNLNQGNIAKARHEVSKSESDNHAEVLSLSNELTRAELELQAAYEEAKSLKSTILPATEQAFKLSRQGYQAGKLPYLEVLDAQRTLFEARSQYNAALKNYHVHRAEVERLAPRQAAESETGEEDPQKKDEDNAESGEAQEDVEGKEDEADEEEEEENEEEENEEEDKNA